MGNGSKYIKVGLSDQFELLFEARIKKIVLLNIIKTQIGRFNQKICFNQWKISKNQPKDSTKNFRWINRTNLVNWTKIWYS